ncbi:MAG: N-acetylmuramoyl-L-alanine amidase [Actinobacteria bacterium]|nr:N-acetylmuramoyl-L-alanine amidase [Actinomycetota bacterium]
MKKLLFVAASCLALPGIARAGLVTMVARDVPIGPRALQAVAPPIRFNMVGLHWRGSGSVAFSTRTTGGRWSAWQVADDDTDGDPGPGKHDGNVVWVGASGGIRFRTSGSIGSLRAYYLWSRVTTAPRRTLALAGSPAIVSRADWMADEKIVRAKPLYAKTLKLAIVHHTANTNDYTPAQAAAIVRGIETYHVQGNGWNDIGYNFLVDRYGNVYEGRAGGIDKNVIGAHALGFNTGTVGISLIGNFTSVTPPPAMQAALVKLLAWRLDVAHIDPLSKVVYTSGGNLKFKAGTVVTLNAISGHRDTGPTECPGNAAYALLPAIAKRVSLTGLPKLYSPTVSGSLGGPVRFQARLSSSLPWTVTVTGASGVVAASQKGTGATIDWTWPSAGAHDAPYTWTLGAGANVLPATGTIGVAALTPPVPVPAPVVVNPLSSLTATPAVVSPNPDGTGGYVTAAFSLSAPAAVTVKLTSATPGTAVPLTLLSTNLPAGQNSFSWSLASVPDGRYSLVVAATPTGGTAQMQTAPVTVDRTLSGFSVAPSVISPNGDGVADATAFNFTLNQSVPVQLVVEQLGRVVATVFAGTLGPGVQSVAWNGTVNGVRVPDGAYEVVATVTDALGGVTFAAPLTVDATPPTLTLLDPASLRFQLSEPATVTVTVNGQTTVVSEPAGVFVVPWQNGPVTTISAQADDLAGNVGATVTYP